MNFVVLMNQDSLYGKELIRQLLAQNVDFEVILFNKSAKKSTDIELERCAGYWNPPKIEFNKISKVHNLPSVNDEMTIEFLQKNKYSFGIQAGVGIISAQVIACFAGGIVNCHPGKLPEYRGSSSPEWQVSEGKKIQGTIHFINERIDLGWEVWSGKLNLNYNSYNEMRASLYPAIYQVLVKLIKEQKIDKKIEILEIFPTRSYIGNDKIENLKSNWQKYMAKLEPGVVDG